MYIREQVSKLNTLIALLRNDIETNNILSNLYTDTTIASYIVSNTNPFSPNIITSNIISYNNKFVRINLKCDIDIDINSLNNFHQIHIADDQTVYSLSDDCITSARINGMTRKITTPIYNIHHLEEFLISDIESFKPHMKRYNILLHPAMCKEHPNEYSIDKLAELTNGLFTEHSLFLNEVPESIFVPKVMRYELRYERTPTIFTFISNM